MNCNTYFKLVKLLRENKDLANKVKAIQGMDLKINITECVNSLNYDLATHLFIMANYSDLMSIKII